MDESGVFRAIRENGGSHADDEILWCADGTCFPSESWSYPVRKDGMLVGAVMTFLDITESKRAQEEALLTTGALQSAIFNGVNFSSIATDAKGVIQIFNVGAERMLGYTAADVMNKMTPAEISDPQEVIERATALSLEFAIPIAPGFEALVFKASRGIEDIYELTYIRKDGSRFPAVVSVTALRDAQNAIIGYLLIGTDNTARKRVEEEHKRAQQVLAERSAQLEAANKELDSFAYSVSHDLRAPLRAIDGFSQLLEEDYGEKLDAEGHRAIARIVAGTRTMARLIDDLLKLSRVSRGELRRERVDLSEIARNVAAGHRLLEPDRKVEVIIASGAVVEGDPELLRVALENLLGNAFKFTSKTAGPRIEFGVERNGEAPVFFVRDNGAGFDPAYAGKLFGAFQRLHTDAEFSGTGIGLATVQRIMNRYGGRVWAEGRVDEGATFYFTLGKE
jgi:signal transduction histidine kinase